MCATQMIKEFVCPFVSIQSMAYLSSFKTIIPTCLHQDLSNIKRHGRLGWFIAFRISLIGFFFPPVIHQREAIYSRALLKMDEFAVSVFAPQLE